MAETRVHAPSHRTEHQVEITKVHKTTPSGLQVVISPMLSTWGALQSGALSVSQLLALIERGIYFFTQQTFVSM